MNRGSDKHGPKLDEEMKRESQGLERGAPVDPRREEHRKLEGGEDDFEPAIQPHADQDEGEPREP